MRSAWLFAVLTGLLLAAPALAGDDEGKEKPEVEEATDKEAKHELTIFERDFDTADIDFQLDALKRVGKCVHDDVKDLLIKLLFKEKDPHLRAEAARGLGNQIPFAKEIGRKTARLLDDRELDHRILEALIRSLGKLGYTRAWEQIAEYIAHEKDEVVIACFDVFGEWKDIRPYRDMLDFWTMYPDEVNFQTGTVNVDTGASGSADARAAKAKWKAKYGNKNKQRPRPECVKALRAAIAKITGEEGLDTKDKFKEWCDDHKDVIKRAERKRD